MVRKISSFIIMGIISVLLLYYVEQTKEEQKVVVEEKDGSLEEEVIRLWYSDSSYNDYFLEISEEFNKKHNIKVECYLVSSIDYIMNIYEKNKEAKEAPDIFLIRSEQLEQVNASGLATEYNEEIVSKKEFYDKALQAATIKDKIVAYPLSFNTTVLAYNKKFIKNEPKTFDDIKAFADTFEGDADGVVNYILKWDVKNLLFNYGFVGNYLEVRKDSTNNEIISVNNENALKAASYYHDLYQYFSIELSGCNYDEIIKQFIKGEIITTIVDTSSIKQLEESKNEIGLARVPNSNKEIFTKPLSINDLIVVNPYSKKREDVEKLAKFITVDKAERLLEMTNKIPSSVIENYTDYQQVFVDQYKDSSLLPNLITTSDFWIRAENMLNSIWIGSNDTKEELDSLQKVLELQIK